MISREEIEKKRSPRGLRLFVRRVIEKVRLITDERHKAMRRVGLYKVFTDEIIPLSLFALRVYPTTYSVQPVIGNQGYDALVKNKRGRIVDHLEITWPQYGKRKSDDALMIVRRGYGDIDVYSPVKI